MFKSNIFHKSAGVRNRSHSASLSRPTIPDSDATIPETLPVPSTLDVVDLKITETLPGPATHDAIDSETPPASARPPSPSVSGSGEIPMKLTFGPYTGSKNPEWIGFDRSLLKKNNRYMARYRYCQAIMQCRLEAMALHKKKCTKMPENIQVHVSRPFTTTAVPVADSKANTIPDMFLENINHQEKCDYLMAMFYNE